jgi:2-polyprenyl-6-methoxyphenol hydroxylase-like FAD-dependent oxidoreductase
MRIVCVGGGPAGLYFAILAKRCDAGHEVSVLERDPEGATYGFGVTCGDDLLDMVYSNDVESARQIRAAAQLWQQHEVRLPGEIGYLPGYGYTITRTRLLEILTARARALGVDVRHEASAGPAELAGADLVVAADGAGSALREAHADAFGTTVVCGRNRYIWLGTTKRFDRFSFFFAPTPGGWLWAFAYPSSEDTSTFIVECTEETWRANGFDELSPTDSIAECEKFLAEYLDGHPLIGETSGKASRWLQFKEITNRTWCHGTVVLVGDAAHTTHFTMGFGTRLAMIDAAVLAQCLHENPLDLGAGLGHYERVRRPVLAQIQAGGRTSMAWFENVEHYLDRNAVAFAYALTGRRSRNSPWRYQKHLAVQNRLGRDLRRRYDGTRRWLGAARRGEYALPAQVD